MEPINSCPRWLAMRGRGLWQLLGALPGLVAIGGCTGRQAPVPVTNAVISTNPQLDLAAAILRETGTPVSGVERGQSVVMGTASCEMGRTCFSCFQCHGIRGEGGSAAALPRLAGQDPRYLIRSLEDFASGARESATMREVAQALTPQQRQDVALYYSVVTAPPALMSSTLKDDPTAQAGIEIEQQGLPNAGVPACATCHSAEVRSQGPPYPYLAGQYADYLERQIEQFRAGTRRGPDAQVMQTIARNLTTEQARGLSVHFASQAPPRNLSQQAALERHVHFDASGTPKSCRMR